MATAAAQIIFPDDPELIQLKEDIRKLLNEGKFNESLFLAVKHGFKELVEEAIKKGGLKTLIHEAVKKGDVKIIEVLISKGANINSKNEDGATPLHEAARRGNVRGYTEIVKLLINKGADVNARDNAGRTPLHDVSPWHSPQPTIDILQMLIDKGAKLNLRDNQGVTPLQAAFLQPVAQFLKESGADPIKGDGKFRPGTEPEGFYRTSYLGEIEWGTPIEVFKEMQIQPIENLKSLYYNGEIPSFQEGGDENYIKVCEALTDMIYTKAALEFKELEVYQKGGEELKCFGVDVKKIEYMFFQDTFIGVCIHSNNENEDRVKEFRNRVFEEYRIGLEIRIHDIVMCGWVGDKTKMVLTEKGVLFMASKKLMTERKNHIVTVDAVPQNELDYYKFYYDSEKQNYFLLDFERNKLYIHRPQNFYSSLPYEECKLPNLKSMVKRGNDGKYRLNSPGWRHLLLLGDTIPDDEIPADIQRKWADKIPSGLSIEDEMVEEVPENDDSNIIWI